MTSTSITKLGGVMVVTQVISQDDTSIPLHSAATATQAPPQVAQTPRSGPPKVDDMTAAFLQGQPQGLGVVQIIVGILFILFSLTAVYSEVLIVHAPFCLAVTFVCSGSLTLAGVKRTSVKLVWASLVWNVISVVVGLVGVAYICWLLAVRPVSEQFCETFGEVALTDYERSQCIGDMWMLDLSVNGSLGLLLVLLVLQICVAITVCVFSAKAIRRSDRYTPIMVEVDDDRALLSGPAAHSNDVTLLDGDGEQTSTSPTNSP